MEDNNPKAQYGLKKPQLHLSPLPALEAMAAAFELGAKKYGAYNWRTRNVSISTYIAAAERHLRAYWEGQQTDPESGHHHLGHAMACMAILIDAGSFGKLIDDRPSPCVHGATPESPTKEPENLGRITIDEAVKIMSETLKGFPDSHNFKDFDRG